MTAPSIRGAAEAKSGDRKDNLLIYLAGLN